MNLKCIKCGREVTRENAEFLQVPPGIAGCKDCFVIVNELDDEIDKEACTTCVHYFVSVEDDIGKCDHNFQVTIDLGDRIKCNSYERWTLL